MWVLHMVYYVFLWTKNTAYMYVFLIIRRFCTQLKIKYILNSLAKDLLELYHFDSKQLLKIEDCIYSQRKLSCCHVFFNYFWGLLCYFLLLQFSCHCSTVSAFHAIVLCMHRVFSRWKCLQFNVSINIILPKMYSWFFKWFRIIIYSTSIHV